VKTDFQDIIAIDVEKNILALHYSVMKILMKNYRKLSFLLKRGIQMKARNNIIATS